MYSKNGHERPNRPALVFNKVTRPRRLEDQGLTLIGLIHPILSKIEFLLNEERYAWPEDRPLVGLRQMLGSSVEQGGRGRWDWTKGKPLKNRLRIPSFHLKDVAYSNISFYVGFGRESTRRSVILLNVPDIPLFGILLLLRISVPVGLGAEYPAQKGGEQEWAISSGEKKKSEARMG